MAEKENSPMAEEAVPQASTTFQVGDQVLDGWGREVEVDDDGNVDYTKMTKKDLQALIDQRNENREEDDLIEPEGTTKGDLVAALEADDEANDEDDDDEE